MKTSEIIKTDKTVTEQLRDIRDKLSLEIKDLSLEELKQYLNGRETLHTNRVWQKKADKSY